MHNVPLEIPSCPRCGKSYGVNVRKDGTIRCKLCGYEGETKKCQ